MRRRTRDGPDVRSGPGSRTSGAEREALVEGVWCAYQASSRVLHARARAGLIRGGLTFPRVLVLRLLVHRGRASSKELARAMGVSTADLPGLLDKLESDRFVTRRRDATDRRVVYVEATPRGRRKLRALWRAAIRELTGGFAEWSDAELGTLRDLLVRLAPFDCAAVGETGPPPRSDGEGGRPERGSLVRRRAR